MGDDNRINNNDQRREVNRLDRSTLDRAGRLGNTDRQNKSEFQKILEQSNNNADSSQTGFGGLLNSTATKEAVQPASSQQERYGKDKEGFKKNLDEKDDTKDSKKTNSKDSGTPSAKIAEKKVVSRSSVSDRGQHKGEGQSGQGGSGSGSGGKTGQQGKQGRGFSSPLLAKDIKGMRSGGIGEGKSFQVGLQGSQTSLVGSKTATSAPNQVLSKEVLDQVIQYCRLVTKTDGDKEMDMQLKEEIFKGLRLKISMVKGKIDATFMAPSEEVLALFQARKSDIQKALQEKGIEVRSIRVIIS